MIFKQFMQEEIMPTHILMVTSLNTREVATLQQKIIMLVQIISLRLGLLEVLRSEKYTPKTICQNCQHDLTVAEIIVGFNNNSVDYSTCCPKCHKRINGADLECHLDGSTTISLRFFCALQVLERLKNKNTMTPQELLGEDPSAYRSAIIHFGSLTAAFSKIGIKYPFKDKEKTEWQAKVLPYLGQVSDIFIASVVGVSRGSVRRLRETHKIAPFDRIKFINEE